MMVIRIFFILWIPLITGMQHVSLTEEINSTTTETTPDDLYAELFVQAQAVLLQTTLKYKNNPHAIIQGLESYEQSLTNFIKKNREIIEHKESCSTTCRCSQEELINALHDQIKEHTELIEVQLALYLEKMAQLNEKIMFHSELLKRIHEKMALDARGLP